MIVKSFVETEKDNLPEGVRLVVPGSKVLYLDLSQDSLYSVKKFACSFAPEESRIVSGSDEMLIVLTLKSAYRENLVPLEIVAVQR